MAHIEWLDSFTCNIELIDEQHKEILDHINQLDGATATRDREAVGRVLNLLVSAVISHFEFEEELMAQSGYGYLKAHKKLHDRFIERLVVFTQRYDAGECIVEEISPFLESWIAHHIIEDRDFCQGIASEINGPQRKPGWFSRTFGGGA
jgi:hemerythrin